MKCPKCHYLSFEPEARCRNCGYDLALSDGELPLRAESTEGPLADLELRNQTARKKAPDSLGAIHPYGDVAPEPDLPPLSADEPPVWAPVRRAPRPEPRAKAMAEPTSEPMADDSLPPPRRARPAARQRVETPELDESGLPAIRRPGAAVKTVTPAEPLPPPRPAPPAPVVRAEQKPPARPAPTTELPLFVKGMGQGGSSDPNKADEPMIRVPAVPRPPVAVQRRAPDSGRAKPPSRPASVAPAAPPPAAAPASQAAPVVSPAASVSTTPRGVSARALDGFGRDLLQDLERLDRTGKRQAGAARSGGAPGDEAALLSRVSSAAIDLGFLGLIGAAVFWLTLRWTGLGAGQMLTLPVVPIGAFILMLTLGYLLLFTAAGGQTIGKMAVGLRVVSDEYEGDTAAVSPRQAAVRALTSVPSVGALGLGFIIPALTGRNQALHDHVAHTRVVHA